MNEDGRIHSMFKILFCNPQEKIPMTPTNTDRWKNNCKVYVRQTGCKEVNQTSWEQNLTVELSRAPQKLRAFQLMTKLFVFYQTQRFLTILKCYASNDCKLHNLGPNSGLPLVTLTPHQTLRANQMPTHSTYPLIHFTYKYLLPGLCSNSM